MEGEREKEGLCAELGNWKCESTAAKSYLHAYENKPQRKSGVEMLGERDRPDIIILVPEFPWA